MGFGRTKDAKLRFISSVNDRPPKKHERVLMHRALVPSMDCETRNVDVLAMDFGQKIRLGRMEIELYPAGLGPGSAQLMITYRNRRILYCGGIRTAKPLASPPSEVPICDVLLMDVAPSIPKPAAPSRAAKDLAGWLETTTRRGPAVLLCGSKSAVLDVAWVLRSLSFKVHAARAVYDLICHSAPVIGMPGDFRRLGKKPVKEGIVLIPEEARSKIDFSTLAPPERIAAVGMDEEPVDGTVVSFRLGDGEDRPGLAAYVKQTGATQIVLGKQCDEAQLSLLKKSGQAAFRVTHPVQIPFPFLSRRQ
jgi:hypothetical protein